MVLQRQIFSAGTKPPTVAEIVEGIQRPSARLMFASSVVSTGITLSTVASDLTLPSVIIPSGAIPSGFTVNRVFAALSWRKSIESSGALNALSASQSIQVRRATTGTYIDASVLLDNNLHHLASATDGGILIVGSIDIKAEVTGAGTFEFRWHDADVDGNSITFYDVQSYLIVELS